MKRRRLLQSLACAVPVGAGAQASPASPLEALRILAAAHGMNLGENRLRALLPVLESRAPRLRSLREMEIDDQVAPTQGIL
ncbi:MAG: hypothetical protein IT166_03460 [Bryobacterales bacterium]|nr:hypothetical protein [Bryobacterales bacterium]